MACLQDGLENAERAPAQRVQLHLGADIALDGPDQQVVALGRRTRHPVWIVESLADDAMMDLSLLAKIQGREVKTESFHAPDQALHVGPARMEAPIRPRLVAMSLRSRRKCCGPS